MALRIELTPRADVDIEALRLYLVVRNPRAAESVRQAIEATFQVLTEHPLAGRDRPELEARSFGVIGYPYTIYYRVEIDCIAVVHLRDDRRRPLSPGTL